MNKKPFHEMVAERLIQQLKEGTAPWQRPWDTSAPNACIPLNPVTGKRYKGINAIVLMSESRSDPRWMTYKQAETVGAQVRKGEKGSLIQYWKFTEEKIKKDSQDRPMLDANGRPMKIEVRLERPRVFYATVFNAEQMDGLSPFIQKSHNWDAITRAEQVLKLSGAAILHSESNRAFYRPSTDTIHLPHKSQFSNANNYYAVALHELGHWTGHASRMDRDLSHPFGSQEYAKEELRAEITSMILGDELGIGHDPKQHVAYVESWIKVLQDDPLELFRAAAEAEKMQQLILSFEQQQELTEVSTKTLLKNPGNLEEGIAMLNEAQSVQESTSDIVWLDIPFNQKETAKAFAGKLPDGTNAIAWDKEQSRWFAKPGADLEKLKPWLKHQTDSFTSSGERTELVVPYEQREQVKQIAGTLSDGRKAVVWDKALKCWFALPGANLEKLKPWVLTNASKRQTPALSPQQEFSDILRSLGCLISDGHPFMDGKKQRIQVEGDKNSEKSGFYVGHLDGHPAGYVINNRTKMETKWKSKGYSLTVEERASLHANAALKIQERLEKQRQDQELAAHQISIKLADLIPVSSPTPYLQTKGIKSFGEIFTDKDKKFTYIPAIDVNGKIWSMQTINDEGVKRFTKNSRKEGCFHALGGLNAIAEAPALVIAEGYATAATLSQEFGFATISAFDSGNLESVAKALQQKFSDKPIIIMGDDDKYLEMTQGINPGKTKAIQAAKAVNGTTLFPIFAPDEQALNPKTFSDFNDLANKSVLGFKEVKLQVKGIIESAIQKNKLCKEELIEFCAKKHKRYSLKL